MASAPDAPATPTTQSLTRNIVREYAPPPSPVVQERKAEPVPVVPVRQTGSDDIQPPPPPPAPAAPVLLREHIVETAGATVGVAQVDRSAEVFAKISSMRPVQYFGALLVLAALSMFHPVVRVAVGGGKQMQAIVGGAGVLCIFGPQLLAGNEKLLLIGTGVAVLVAYLISRLSYKEAQADTAAKLPAASPGSGSGTP